jgi:hypothetical protein
MATRKELVQAIRERYRGATRKQRRSILDEFVAVTGCHRKHAIRVLSGGETVTHPRPPRTRITARQSARRSSCCGKHRIASAASGSSRSFRSLSTRSSATATSSSMPKYARSC